MLISYGLVSKVSILRKHSLQLPVSFKKTFLVQLFLVLTQKKNMCFDMNMVENINGVNDH